MEYGKIKGVDKPISRILFGTVGQNFTMGRDNCALLDAAVEAGITTIDTARKYAFAEKSLGMWLKKDGNREKVVILSKCAHPGLFGNARVNETAIRNDFVVSTRNLCTDYIDIYLLHRDDTSLGVDVAVEVMNALHSEGKIGAFGGSNWTHERIEAANEYAYKKNLIPFTLSSPHFSLARQDKEPWKDCVSITGEQNTKARDWYRKNDMPIVAYSSLGRGLLTGKFKSAEAAKAAKYMDGPARKAFLCDDNITRLSRCEELAAEKNATVAQIALAWLLHQPLNVFPIVTMSSPKRVAENAAALDIKLSPEELKYLNLGE